MFRTVPLSIIRRFHCTYSTCFGQFLCPSSGDLTVFTLHVSDSSSVHHQEISLYLLYMFRTVPLSIIRRFHCTYSSCFGQFLCPSSGDFTVLTLHVSDSSSVHHQEFFTVLTLHVSDSSSVHHQEFFTAHTAMVYVIQVC